MPIDDDFAEEPARTEPRRFRWPSVPAAGEGKFVWRAGQKFGAALAAALPAKLRDRMNPSDVIVTVTFEGAET